MPQLLVIVFLIEVFVHVVNAVGSGAFNDLLWTVVNYLPVATSQRAKDQKKLQSEYLKVRKDMNATSSQDQFAKWAKLRRQHDKLLEQLEASKKNLDSSRARFDKILTSLRFVLTRAPQYIIPFWYAKEPMLWLPYGWFPYWAEWIISFPKAPLGSVSIASWQLACSGMVKLVGELVVGIWGLMAAVKPATKTKTRSEPMKANQEEKKDL